MASHLSLAIERHLEALPLRSASFLFAFALAVTLGTILFAFPRHPVSVFYLSAGTALAALVYALVPVERLIAVFGEDEAGGALLVMVCAVLTWTAAFWMVTYFLVRGRAARRARRAVSTGGR